MLRVPKIGEIIYNVKVSKLYRNHGVLLNLITDDEKTKNIQKG